MFKKTLLFMLLMTLLAPWAVGQQALPYSYGFEDNALATDGWTSTGGAIYSGAAYNSSSYGYRFSYSISSDVFLMSPILTGGTNGVNVSFYYKAYSGSYLDHFYVGYTTDQTVTDPSAFTYGTMVTSSTSWQLYEEALPAGTVRVAIKYDVDNYDDGYYLYLDDFSFTAASSCVAPTNALATYTSGTTATVTWDGSAASYNLNVNGTITSGVSSPYVLNVAPATTYTVKVQADCGSEQSAWVTAGTFTTDCPTSFSIPYTYGFEDEGGISCWTIEADNDGFTGVQNNTWAGTNLGGSYARTGEGFFFFLYTDTPPHYLISPLLSGISNGLHVEFWYRQYTNGVETFQVGYSTTDNDPSSFTWDAEVTASTTYQRYSANYPAGTKYVAVMLTSDDQYYLFLDDFVFEESASCLEPTAVTVTNQTTSGATVNWTAGGTETEWDIFVTDDATITPDDATTPTVASTSTKPYTLTGLTSATTYYVYVRAICAKPSAWSSPAIFNTECEGMVLPYSYDFQDDELPICWSTINTNTSYTAVGNMAPSSSSTNRVLYFYRGSSTGTLVAVLPEVDSHYSLSDYQITFDACYANGSGGSMTAGKLGIGIMDDPTDFTTFELIEEVDITDGFSTYGSHTVMFNNYTGHGQYIAIQDIHTQSGYVLVDNIEVTELPSCIPPTNLEVNGGLNAVVTWDGTAPSFDIAFSDDPTVDPETVIVGNTGNTSFELYKAVTLTEGDYTVWVRSNCGGSYSTWASTTLSLSYCTPNPTSHDGKGITAVSFGTGSYVVNNGDGSASLPASSPFYGDYSSMIGAVYAGVEATIAITTGTGSFPYTFVIWVDLDNDFTFEDDEILYIGKASSGNGTLNASITVPAAQAVGDYRMRIYGADSYFTSFYGSGTTNWSAAHDPCSSGTYRHAHDYTLRVLEAPSCLAPSGLGAIPSATSAQLSWTANSGETSWNIYYKKTSETDYTELKKVTDNPYPLTGLDAATDYEYYVVANCSSTETSDPSAVYYFTTKCDLITTLPWSEDFESYSTGNFNETCWVNEHIAGSATYVFQVSSTTLGTNNTKKLQLPDENDGNMIKLVLPGMTLPNSNYAFFIDVYRSSNYSSYTTEGIRVFASTNGEIEGATELAFIPRVYSVASGIIPAETTADSWYTYALPINMSGTCYIILRGESKYGASTYMDNFMVASCYPVGTLSYDNLASQTVDLHWTLVDATQDAWQVCINGDETNPVEITATDVTINGNVVTYSMSGLTAETAYTVKVRANCGGGDFGKWSNTISFSTLAACATPTGLAASNLTQNGANLAWTGSSDVDYYTVQYRIAAGNDGSMLNENFNSLTDANSIPEGWDNTEGTTSTASYKWCYNTNTSGNGATNGTSYDGSKCVRFNSYMNGSGNTNFLKTPTMNFPAGKTMQLSFWWKNPKGDDFSVFISTDGGTTQTAIAEGLIGQSTWIQKTINLTGYEGASNVTIHFKGTSNYGSGDAYIYLDDVVIGEVLTAGAWQTAADDVTEWEYTLTGLTADVKYDARVYANCTSDPETENSMTTFTTLADGNIVFPDEGNWAAGNFEPTGAPTITDDVIIRDNVTVTSGTNAYANNIALENSSVITVANGATLTLAGNVTGGNSASIIVEQGGQLIHSNAVNATLQINVTGYSSKADNAGYRLIASPINSSYYSPSTAGLTTGTYDLYSFDQSQDLEWRNYEANAFSYLTLGKGYLYANASGVNGTFAGSTVKTDTDKTYTLAYTTGAKLAGWNLVGNPFTCNAYVKVNNGTETNYAPYYVLNTTGDALNATAVAAGTPVVPMQGLFVKATDTDQSCIFTTTAPSKNSNLNIKVSQNSAMVDNAIISFRDGSTLEKLSFNEGSTKVYMPVDGKDYAVVNAESKGEMPVNFKAETNGTYTISFNNENVNFNYLHLIDNMTGNDVDLLKNPSYTFDARTTDYASRFRLVFATSNNGDDSNFGFISDGNIIIPGNTNATVQVIDALGRILVSENGVNSVSTMGMTPGVYVLRLINGNDVKVQKIVVK